MDWMTRGELARQGQVNPETIRYYERSGLLPAPVRSESNYRLFAPGEVQRIRFIKRAQAVGFSLDEIRALLDLKYAPEATCARWWTPKSATLTARSLRFRRCAMS